MRYYDPEVGRFTQMDVRSGEMGMPQSMNRYVYCMNDPVSSIDPSGMKGEKPMQEKYWSNEIYIQLGKFITDDWKPYPIITVKPAITDLSGVSLECGLIGIVDVYNVKEVKILDYTIGYLYDIYWYGQFTPGVVYGLSVPIGPFDLSSGVYLGASPDIEPGFAIGMEPTLSVGIPMEGENAGDITGVILSPSLGIYAGFVTPAAKTLHFASPITGLAFPIGVTEIGSTPTEEFLSDLFNKVGGPIYYDPL